MAKICAMGEISNNEKKNGNILVIKEWYHSTRNGKFKIFLPVATYHFLFFQGESITSWIRSLYLLRWSTIQNFLFYNALTKLFSFIKAYNLQVYS